MTGGKFSDVRIYPSSDLNNTSNELFLRMLVLLGTTTTALQLKSKESCRFFAICVVTWSEFLFP